MSPRRSVVEKDPAGHSVQELRALLEISRSLHRSIHLDELLPFITSKAKELMDSETVAVLLHDPAQDELFFRFTEGNPEHGASRLKEIRFPADAGIAGSVFRSGEPELIDDVTGDLRHYKVVDRETAFETRTMVAVPLHTRGKTIGVL